MGSFSNATMLAKSSSLTQIPNSGDNSQNLQKIMLEGGNYHHYASIEEVQELQKEVNRLKKIL